jgi:hypothetical protein
MGDYLKGKVAIVTGPDRVFGRAIAMALCHPMAPRSYLNNRKPAAKDSKPSGWQGQAASFDPELHEWSAESMNSTPRRRETARAIRTPARGRGMFCASPITIRPGGWWKPAWRTWDCRHVVNVAADFGWGTAKRVQGAVGQVMDEKPTDTSTSYACPPIQEGARAGGASSLQLSRVCGRRKCGLRGSTPLRRPKHGPQASSLARAHPANLSRPRPGPAQAWTWRLLQNGVHPQDDDPPPLMTYDSSPSPKLSPFFLAGGREEPGI